MRLHRVENGKRIHLKELPPDDSSGFADGKDAAHDRLLALNTRLDSLQESLYAENRRGLLVVLQGMDTSGKDGTVRAVFEGVNPQGVRVTSFKVPSAEEMEHDFLWRIHQQTPGKGEIVVFNRSHYEDVLVVRVHNLVTEDVWKRRYDQINAFERELAAEGTVIVKFFLHISKDEQKARLLERLEDPTKQWKFTPSDLKERVLWDQYQAAYEDALSQTSTDWAPWYVIPADKKWYRNLAIATELVNVLEDMKIQPPPTLPDADTYRRQLEQPGA